MGKWVSTSLYRLLYLVVAFALSADELRSEPFVGLLKSPWVVHAADRVSLIIVNHPLLVAPNGKWRTWPTEWRFTVLDLKNPECP